eukprot:TRINITY_DN46974_c0_g1_i1.p1 TRINITY_DN46974_c0_g1~~TRINITY_DN46974_c0_g1_i1.p1  ORF type:complete len:267 (+),score=52.99 TRINITY_DN46974_c0_g1_i1:49-801(+)
MGAVQSAVVDAVLCVWVGRTRGQDGSVLYVSKCGTEEVLSKEELEARKYSGKRVVCISDTHGYHEKLDLPEADLLVVAGDIMLMDRFQPMSQSKAKVRAFGKWVRRQKCRNCVVVGGNHDIAFEQLGAEEMKSLLGPGVTYADHELLNIEGLQVFASPRSFGVSKNVAFQGRRNPFGDVPKGVDILITHHPAKNDGHMCDLLKRTSPRLHVGGHYHWLYGALTVGSTLSVTASVCDSSYKPTQRPIVVDL